MSGVNTGNVVKSAIFGLVGEVCFGVAGESPAWDMVVDG